MSTPYSPEQVQELKVYCRKLLAFTENNITYFLLEGLRLPEGCSPQECDAVLCPVDRGDGYASRLFFSTQVTGLFERNWHVSDVRLAERQWTAFSWRVTVSGLTLAQLLREHLSALVKQK